MSQPTVRIRTLRTRLSLLTIIGSSFLTGCAMDSVENAEPTVSDSPTGAASTDENPPSDDTVAMADAEIVDDGCSGPWIGHVLLSAVTLSDTKKKFAPACRFHDFCYEAGLATYGDSRATCDSEFRSAMYQICKGDKLCGVAANAMYTAVRDFGAPHYKSSPCTRGEVNTSCSSYEPYRAGRMPAFVPRIAASVQRQLWLGEGAGKSPSPWTNLTSSAIKYQANGFRVGILASDGTLWVKEGAANHIWIQEMNGVKDFELSGNRIAALTQGGTLYVKETGLSAAWVNEISNVTAMDLNGKRIGALLTTKDLVVKEGGLSANWVTLANNVTKFQLDGSRVGALMVGGALHVKEGGLSATWLQMAGNVSDFQVKGDRVAARYADNSLRVKAGPLTAVWSGPRSGVSAFQVSGSRVAALGSDGVLWAMDGDPTSATWYELHGGVKQMMLSGDRIGVLLTNGVLRVKAGPLGDTWQDQPVGPVESFTMWTPSDWNQSDYSTI